MFSARRNVGVDFVCLWVDEDKIEKENEGVHQRIDEWIEESANPASLLLKAVDQVVEDQAKQIHVNQSFQKANLFVLKPINLQRIQEQIHNAEHKEDPTHDFLVLEKNEIRLLLNRFRIHDLVIGDLSILVVEYEHAVSLFI